MKRIFRIASLVVLLSVSVSTAFADPTAYPDIVEIEGIIYTKVIIDSGIYYENCGVLYIYYPELGEMMEAEITFPY